MSTSSEVFVPQVMKECLPTTILHTKESSVNPQNHATTDQLQARLLNLKRTMANETVLQSRALNDIHKDLDVLKASTDQMFLILMACLIFCK